MPGKPRHARLLLRRAALPVILGAGSLYLTLQAGIAAALRYDRAAIMAGEWWRLLSGHLVQGNLAHWALNMLGLVLILIIFPERISWRGFGAPMLLLALAIGGGLFFLNPEIAWYVGLSGLLHGLFAAYASRELLAGSLTYALALALLAAKIAYEQVIGPLADARIMAGLPVVVDAHFYGAAGGLAFALVFYIPWRNIRNRLSTR